MAAGVHPDLGNLYNKNFLCTRKAGNQENDDPFFQPCIETE